VIRNRIRARHLLPLACVGGVAVVSMMTSAASGSPSTSGSGASLDRANGMAPIIYTVPTNKSAIKAGEVLFEANCASCHGPDAEGGTGPNLVGLGPATISFWVSTGRMPLAAADVQAARKPPRFNEVQTRQIAAFVNSLGKPSPGYPVGIPHVNLNTTNLAMGNSLFVLNCAACHTITGSGDALANGANAPTLHRATATQVAEAVRTGPGNMPFFGPHTLTDQQVADIVAYVMGPIQNPDNRGGLGLGGIGPVAEGFVALLIGVGACMLIAFWLGDRERAHE
jgi:ubiquinol-cytochrome c reductase cytochrome c subunit